MRPDPLPPNIFCLGRTYAAHAAELGNAAPAAPLVFMKPWSAVVDSGGEVMLPRDGGVCHHEVELVVEVGAELWRPTEPEARAAIRRVAVAIDLTLRGRQSELKAKGHPWEAAKAFEGACPLSELVEPGDTAIEDMALRLERNGELVQSGAARQMALSLGAAVARVGSLFKLRPGDLILTGSPPGVGPVEPGDRLVATLGEPAQARVEVKVRREPD